MQAQDLRARLRSFSFRRIAKPALYLACVSAAASSCAAELENPDLYTVARNEGSASGGSPPAATGGTPGQGGRANTTGGTPSTPTGGTQGGTVTLDDCVKTVFSSQCTSCHSTAAKSFYGDLDLSGDDVISRLKDIPATNKGSANMANCVPGALLINSANPAESVLLKRVAGTQNCGNPMPFAPGLTGQNLSCIQSWVMKF